MLAGDPAIAVVPSSYMQGIEANYICPLLAAI
jgi:hypothetical protein